MAKRWSKSRGKGQRSRKPHQVTKLSPEQPAARDEGPRLLPLPSHSREDPLAGRLERYLSLADTAFGRPAGKTGQLTSVSWSEIAEPAAEITEKLPRPEDPSLEDAVSPPEVSATAPAHPKLDIPRPPARPDSPRPPKLAMPKPPRRPSPPKPPKLSAPRPPRRPR